MSTTSTEQPKVILYWLEKSRSQRIIWLLEECKIPYEVKTYKRVDRLAPPELKKIHPLGKSPVVSVQAPGQAEPFILAESAAICEYLADHFAHHLIPTRYKAGQDGKVGGETESWIRYRFYMHYAEGSLMSLLLLRYLINALAGPEVPFFIRPVTKLVVNQMNSLFLDRNMTTHLDFLEAQVASSPGGGQYLCGSDLTAADILMSYPLLAAKTGMGDALNDAKYPKLSAYIARMEASPNYQASIKKAEELTGEKYILF